MTVQRLSQQIEFQIVAEGASMETEITRPFCCDLLSIAMSKAPAGCAWVTVMANENTIAVAALTEAACVILAEGVKLSEAAIEKAKQHGVTVLSTSLPIYEAASRVECLCHQG